MAFPFDGVVAKGMTLVAAWVDVTGEPAFGIAGEVTDVTAPGGIVIIENGIPSDPDATIVIDDYERVSIDLLSDEKVIAACR